MEPKMDIVQASSLTTHKPRPSNFFFRFPPCPYAYKPRTVARTRVAVCVTGLQSTISRLHSLGSLSVEGLLAIGG